MKLSWEPFQAERIGYEALSRWLTEFYADPPWNEYRKCFACSSPTDFGPEGLYGRPTVERERKTPSAQIAAVAPMIVMNCGSERRTLPIT